MTIILWTLDIPKKTLIMGSLEGENPHSYMHHRGYGWEKVGTNGKEVGNKTL